MTWILPVLPVGDDTRHDVISLFNMPSKDKTSRNYCWTLYEPFPELPIVFDEDTVKYCVYQKEECPETKKLHLQGYVELKKSIRFAALKKLFGREDLHIEQRRGTRDEARDYCRKEESRVAGPWEFVCKPINEYRLINY